MQQRTTNRKSSTPIDRLYRGARKATPASEDEALNALCDARLKERRYPLARLLKKLGHELEE